MKSKLAITLGSVFLIVILVTFLGCNHEKYPTQTDDGHIESYILNEDHAKDLFRVDGVFPETPYQWPGDNRIYYDSVLSVEREFETYVSDSAWDHGSSLGWVRESISRVSDNFLVRTFQIDGVDTTFTDANRLLVRSGYFLKLAQDSYYYYGWGLWGIGYFQQSSPPVTAALWFADSSSIRADFDLYHEQFHVVGGEYRRLSDLEPIPDSTEARIDVAIANIGSPTRYITMITYTSDSGYVRKRLDLIDSEHASGTILLHEKPEIAYDFIVVTVFNATFPRDHVKSWTVPYRVNPL